jgi:crossover junction endodeoxyribonuclease RusA
MKVLSLPYPVSANRNWKSAGSHTYVSQETKVYKSHVLVICRQAHVKRLTGDVAVTYMLHPRRNVDGTASKRRLDLDNCQKVVTDALNGIAWIDDKQIVDFRVMLGEPVDGGALTVTIEGL